MKTKTKPNKQKTKAPVQYGPAHEFVPQKANDRCERCWRPEKDVIHISTPSRLQYLNKELGRFLEKIEDANDTEMDDWVLWFKLYDVYVYIPMDQADLVIARSRPEAEAVANGEYNDPDDEEESLPPGVDDLE